MQLTIMLLGIAWVTVLVSFVGTAVINHTKKKAIISMHPCWRKHLVLTGLSGVILSIFLHGSFGAKITFSPLWKTILSYSGMLLVLAGSFLTLWARTTLGIMWSSAPLIFEGHSIIKTGPYSVVRHPIYTGIILMLLGTFGITGYFILIPLLAAMCILYAGKAVIEERLLSNTVGKKYDAYRKAVPMFFPKLWPKAKYHPPA